MQFKIRLLSLLSLSLLLAGCPLDDVEKIEQAGENIEKEALKPDISSPAENREINSPLTVLVDIDETVQYNSVSLRVEGREVAIYKTAPYEFTWDPYFWSRNNQDKTPVTLAVRAITAGDNLLRSEVRNVIILNEIRNNLQFTQPKAGQNFRNTDQVNISWNARVGAVSYEYQLNNETIERTETTQAVVKLLSVGIHTIKIRATDALGNTGAWSSNHTFNLLPPAAPILDIPSVSENDSGWQINLKWTNTLTGSEVQIATDNQFSSLVSNYNLTENTITEDLVAGNYFARIRVYNEFGHLSEWGEIQAFPVGLFSHAFDIAKNGWFQDDTPVDFVISNKNIVIISSISPTGDGSGDDFYVKKININGTQEWARDVAPVLSSPKSIEKTSTGYLLTGRQSNWRDQGILAINESGNQEWNKIFTHKKDNSEGTEIREEINAAIEIDNNKYLILNRTRNISCEIRTNNGYSYDSCSSTSIENKTIHLERSDGTSSAIETEIINVIDNPQNGTYETFNKILHTDSGIYTAGRYKASNSIDSSADDFNTSAADSGSFLLKLDDSDGSLISERTGGGIANAYSITSLIETNSGNLITGYQHDSFGGATSFSLGLDNTENVIENNLRYSLLAPDHEHGGFIMAGENRTTKKAMLIHYDENNQKVGTPLYFNNCFNNLSIKAIKGDASYGTVILGTDKHGLGGYNDTHTVIFNVINNTHYTCPDGIK